MINPDAMRYALNFCSKYPSHNINTFIYNDIKAITEFVTPFLLVQYSVVDNSRVIYSMFFDMSLWDKSVSSSRTVKAWFKLYDNSYACNLTTTPSLRKYIMRLA